jgi:hypothetical protein
MSNFGQMQQALGQPGTFGFAGLDYASVPNPGTTPSSGAIGT